MTTFSLQPAELFYPAPVADPQQQLFPWLPAGNERQQCAWSRKMRGLQKRAYAARSKKKEHRQLAGAADKIRPLTLNHPCCRDYPWPWPAESATREPAMEENGECRYPVPDGLLYRHYLAHLLVEISREIADGLGKPCRVFEDRHSIRLEFMQCQAWVVLRSPLSFHTEVRDEQGHWQLTTDIFNLFNPLESPGWIDQVLIDWLPRIALLPESEVQAGYDWLRSSLRQRFHNAFWLRGLKRQLRFHLNFATGLNRVLVHFGRLQHWLEIDSCQYREFWRAEPFWSRFHSRNPGMTYFYYLACEFELIDCGDDLGELRSKCRELGLRPAAWRFLGRHGVAAYRAAIVQGMHPAEQCNTVLSYIEWQSQAGLNGPLPAALGKNFVAVSGNILDIEEGFEIDPRIARVGQDHWNQLKSSRERLDFADREWVEVLAWMRDHRPQFDRNQWRTGWPAIWRQYRRWALLSRDDHQWYSLVEGFTEADWRVEPLTSSRDLAHEGIRMRHCVAGYTSRCVAGEHRLFSVRCRSTGKPRATIGLMRNEDLWELGQVSGKCNRRPDPEISGLAARILKDYMSAQRQVELQEQRDWAQQQNQAWLARNKPRLMVSRYRGSGLLLIHSAQRGWQPASPESLLLPAVLLEKFEHGSNFLAAIPPDMMLDEEEWQYVEDFVFDLCTELRAGLPRHFRIFRDDFPFEPAVEVL